MHNAKNHRSAMRAEKVRPERPDAEHRSKGVAIPADNKCLLQKKNFENSATRNPLWSELKV